jgi:hypothetical protein
MKASNLHTAILAVMDEVKGIDKSMDVGTGKNAYKGVADKDVKSIIGKSMFANGLTCVCTNIQPTTRVERWEELDPYSQSMKTKQSVFTEVLATYKITHAESGESMDICGYGHGVDSQDKSAGKATTYALKNALLYTFLVPTGAIDDTDKTHSDQVPTPQTTKQPVKPSKQLPPCSDEMFDKYVEWIATGTKTKSGETITAETLRGRHALNAAQEKALLLIQLEVE